MTGVQTCALPIFLTDKAWAQSFSRFAVRQSFEVALKSIFDIDSLFLDNLGVFADRSDDDVVGVNG